eukprot:c18010_g1_i1.p1 GENE.c18010_g1_i1~~c18010_g1_i1.p1  ORF type:complete len:377 (+),score=70.52 c18010_g1_i1:241-1371(+)
MSYGAPRGNERMLQLLADFINQNELARNKSGHQLVSPDRLMITNGASHSLDLVCRRLSNPGDICLVEPASYYLAANVLRDSSLNIQPVPVDEQGVCVDALDEALASNHYTSPPRLFYIIPAHCNPTGLTLSLERRKKLIDLAHKYKFTIVADEVYHFLDWSSRFNNNNNTNNQTPNQFSPPRMCALDASVADPHHDPMLGGVVSVSAFTKLIGPGMRVGWLEANSNIIQKILHQTGYLCSGGGFNPFVSEMIEEFMLTGGLQHHVDQICQVLQTNSNSTVDELQRNGLSLHATPSGGYFCWVHLPDGVSAVEFLTFAKQNYGVSFVAGPTCDISKQGTLDSMIRLCFAFEPEQRLLQGVARIAEALKEFQNSKLNQ